MSTRATESDEPNVPIEDDEVEFVTLEPGEQPPSEAPPEDPEKEALRRELAELRAKVEPLGAIQQGFTSLGERLDRPVPQPVAQGPQESDEQFSKRLSEELFGQNTYGVLKDAIQRVVSPMLGPLAGTSMATAKKLMKLDPERGDLFKKYEKQIDGVIAGLPASAQNNPQVLEYAYNQVITANMSQIIEDRVNERVGSTRQDPAPQAAPRGVSPSSSAPSAPKKKTVYIPRDVEQRMRRESQVRGIPYEILRADYLESR